MKVNVSTCEQTMTRSETLLSVLSTENSSTVETIKVTVEMKRMEREEKAKILAALLVQGFSRKSHNTDL